MYLSYFTHYYEVIGKKGSFFLFWLNWVSSNLVKSLVTSSEMPNVMKCQILFNTDLLSNMNLATQVANWKCT